MKITRHINSFSTSNTYILSLESEDGVWIIDPGDADFILHWLHENKKIPAGLLVTHSHVDHIYGINTLRTHYPDLYVYLSEKGKMGVLSPRLNLSYYHGNLYMIENYNLRIIKHDDKITLWENYEPIHVHYTLGHNEESLSFYIKGNLFTGDALIPGVRVYTKFHGGDRQKATSSIQKIVKEFDGQTMIRPGHGEDCLLCECEIIL